MPDNPWFVVIQGWLGLLSIVGPFDSAEVASAFGKFVHESTGKETSLAKITEPPPWLKDYLIQPHHNSMSLETPGTTQEDAESNNE